MTCETQDAAFAAIHAEFVRQQAEIAKLRKLLEAMEVAPLAPQKPHQTASTDIDGQVTRAWAAQEKLKRPDRR
jgi:hypothetical protein